MWTFLGLLKLWEFDSNLSNHQENSSKEVLLLFLEFGQEMVKENGFSSGIIQFSIVNAHAPTRWNAS